MPRTIPGRVIPDPPEEESTNPRGVAHHDDPYGSTSETDGDERVPVSRGGSRRPGDNLGDDALPPWYTAPGLRPAIRTPSERTLTFSPTILGSTIPVTYGERKVAAQCGAIFPDTTLRHAVAIFVFGYGEQASIDDIQINDSDISRVNYIDSWNEYLGTDSQTRDSLMFIGTSSLGVDRWDEALLGICYIAMKIDLREADLPGAFKVTATLGGRKVLDPRTGTRIASTNPFVIGYDIEIDTWVWKGLPTTRFSTGVGSRFRELADWADDVMTDTTTRFTYQGTIDRRDPDEALRLVLGHAFGETYEYNNLIYFFAEKAPIAIDGTWTVTASNTAAGSGGSALTQLDVGDIVYIGSYLREVLTVPGDNSFTFDGTAISVTSEYVRPISTVHVQVENLIEGQVSGSMISSATIPDIVTVRYSEPDTWTTQTHYCYNPNGISAGNTRITELTYDGCTSASMAERLGQTVRRLVAYQPHFWDVVVDDVGQELEPGDIIRGSLGDGTSEQAMRVLSKTIQPNDTYALSLQEFDPAAHSEDVSDDDTPISLPPGWSLDDPPDTPTSATQKIMELGHWIVFDINKATPYDITGWNNVTAGAGTVTYDAGEVCTRFQNTSATELGKEIQQTRLNDETYGMVKFVIRLNAGLPDDAYIKVQYATVTTGDTERREWVITPPTDTKYNYGTFCLRFPLEGSTPIGDKIRIVSSTPTGTIDFKVKQVRFVRGGDGPDDPTRTLGYRYLWTWVEDASAVDTVDRYSLVAGSQEIDSVPQGFESLVQDFYPSGVLPLLEGGRGIPPGSGGQEFPVYPRMVTIGHDESTVEFPDETQTFDDPFYLPPLAPSAVALDLRVNTVRRTTDSEEINNWTKFGFPKIISDIETGPSGVTDEADGVEELAYDSKEMVDSDSPDPWYSTTSDNDHMYFVWARRSLGTVANITLCDATNTDLNLHEVVLRSTYNLLIHRTDNIDNPSRNSPLITYGTSAGHAMPATTDRVVLGGAFLWPTPDDGNHKYFVRITWTPADDADTIDGYELQYKLYDTGTQATSADWLVHYAVPKTATKIIWGTANRADCPEFKLTKVLQLYDWRVVAKRGEAVTELIPSTVSEDTIADGTSFQKTREFDDTSTGTILTMPSGAGSSSAVELATVADLGIEDDDIDLSGTHTGLLTSETTVADAMVILDDLDDSDIDLSGSHSGLLNGQTTVADAMDVLDDLNDEDIYITATYTGVLDGDASLDDALDTVDGMSTEFETRQQIMHGSKTSITDNTATKIVTFAIPTGPTGLSVGLTFVGQSEDSTDVAKVVIQGWLHCTRVSGGTVTAEWVEQYNSTDDDFMITGSETFGTCEVTETVATANVEVNVKFDSSINSSWDVKWTALMSDDVTVTAA